LLGEEQKEALEWLPRGSQGKEKNQVLGGESLITAPQSPGEQFMTTMGMDKRDDDCVRMK
jgi:hypothetical protein